MEERADHSINGKTEYGGGRHSKAGCGGRHVWDWVIAGVLFAACFGVFFAASHVKGQERTEYPVVVFGDSLVGQCRTQTAIPVLLEEMLGEPVYNAALGGTCMAVQDGDVTTNYSMELLNMVSLAKALEADDFGVQRTVRSRREITYYFADTLHELPQIDFGKVRTVVLAFGINDYHAGIPLDNERNPYDETSYGGALRSVIRSLQTNYPQIRIVLVTPTYAWYRTYKLTCEEYAPGGAVLEEYVAKELEIGEEFNLDAVDLYHDVYPHEEWKDWKIYTIDGLHPNKEGRQMLAELIAQKMQEQSGGDIR